jgi:hypothetical protein
MASVGYKRLNWVRSPSAWQANQAWRERQAAARENFEAASSSANSAFANANINLVAGLGQIAATVASRRMQNERIAKVLNSLA